MHWWMDMAVLFALPLLRYKPSLGDILLNPAQINLAYTCVIGPFVTCIYHNVTLESGIKARQHELVYESKYTESYSRSTNDCLQSFAFSPCVKYKPQMYLVPRPKRKECATA